MNASDIITPKELQPPFKSRNPFQPKMAPNERYVTEIACDSMCRCPHIDAYLPKYLDTGNINQVKVKNQNGKKRMKRLTISDLHLQSIFPLPSDKDLVESDFEQTTRSSDGNSNSSRFANNFSANMVEEKLNKALGGEFGSCVEIFPPTLLHQSDQERSFESSVKLEQDEFMTIDVTGQLEHENNTAPLQIESGSVVSNQNLTSSVSTSLKNVSSKPLNVTKRSIEECNTVDLQTWNQMRKDRRQDIEEAEKRVETWLENTRQNRLDLYNGTVKTCLFCKKKNDTKQSPIKSVSSKGDGLMQCLDCGVVACGSDYLLHDGHSKRHMQQHFLLSGHNFAITCGGKGEIFCMKCGDFIYSEILQEEKSRIDIGQKIPFYKWERYHKLQRGFSLMENGKDFVVVSDGDTIGDKNSAKDGLNGTIVWRGFQATYDFGVPHEFKEAGKMTLGRLDLLQGTSLHTFTTHNENATDIMLIQSKRGRDYWKIDSPVGIYNVGNICYISSVIQCIVNLRPVQQFFLKDAKHDCKSCELFRSQKSMNFRGSTLRESCIACELDRCILKYYGSTQGLDMSPFISELELPVKPVVKTSLDIEEKQREKGMPMDISDLLFTSWKKKEMSTFACDDQHDCHEFIQVFLDTIDKDCKKYQDSILAARRSSMSNRITNTADDNENEFRQILPGSLSSLFSGSFRSVLMCKSCGYKRTSLEPFLNVSLSLPLKTRQKLDIMTCKYIMT